MATNGSSRLNPAKLLSVLKAKTVQGRSRFWLWVSPVVGLFALVWFLVRVIPKPSRAAYPCQRAAFPLAASFVIWVTGLATYCALAAWALGAEAPTKIWSGRGRTSLASEDANWLMGTRPGTMDWVVFGAMSAKPCDWDLDVTLANLTLGPGYRGTVSLGKSSLEVDKEASVAGGLLDLAEGTLTVRRRFLVDGDRIIVLQS